MLDIENTAEEFVFLRDKLKQIAGCLSRNDTSEASFIVGCLHSICHNHAMTISALIPKNPEEIQAVAHKVYSVLSEIPETRDDDKKLLISIWKRETKTEDLQDFFKEILSGTVSHFESIRRMRQKIQEKHPSLRGEKWDVRHKMEGYVCEQLNLFDKW